jgi:hypothetical protein
MRAHGSCFSLQKTTLVDQPRSKDFLSPVHAVAGLPDPDRSRLRAVGAESTGDPSSLYRAFTPTPSDNPSSSRSYPSPAGLQKPTPTSTGSLQIGDLGRSWKSIYG